MVIEKLRRATDDKAVNVVDILRGVAPVTKYNTLSLVVTCRHGHREAKAGDWRHGC